MTELFADIDDVKICYEIHGEGIPVLLLHGYAMYKEFWLPQIGELSKYFKAPFLGRVTTIPFVPLSDKILQGITMQKLDRVKKRVERNYTSTLEYTQGVVKEIVRRCQSINTGARNIDNIINHHILPQISQYFLTSLAKGRTVKKLTIKIDKKGEFTYEVI